MKNLSRGAWAGLAALTAIPVTVAIAATMEHGRWHEMSPETRARLDEGKLAMAKAALKLNPDQEKLWTPIETHVRDAFKLRDTKREDWKTIREQREKDRAENKRPDMSERIDKMSHKMSERADRMKAFAGSFKPFYASLSDEQKDVLRPLMHDLAPGFGGRHGEHGHRWAQNGWNIGGWGPGGRDGGEHRGWGGGRYHGEHGDRGGDDEGRGGSPEGGPGRGDAPVEQAPAEAPKKL